MKRVSCRPWLLFGVLLGSIAARENATSNNEGLIQACKSGNLDAVKDLVQVADVGYKSEVKDKELGRSGTPLMFASYYGHIDVVQFLLGSGAEVNQQSTFGATALYCASWGNRTSIVKLLIEEHAKLELANKAGWTPLFAAARFDNLGPAIALVEAGANVEARDNLGRTPLLAASETGSFLVAEYLVETVGVRTRAHTNLGRTWANVADVHCPKMQAFVLKHKPDSFEVFVHTFTFKRTWYTIVASFLTTVLFLVVREQCRRYDYRRMRRESSVSLSGLDGQVRMLLARKCIAGWKYHARLLQYFVDIVSLIVFPFAVCLTLMTPALFFFLVICICSLVVYQQHRHSGVFNVMRQPALLLQPRVDKRSDFKFRLTTVIAIILLLAGGYAACDPHPTEEWNIQGKPVHEITCHGELSNHKAWHFIAPETSKFLWPTAPTPLFGPASWVQLPAGAQLYQGWIMVLTGITATWVLCVTVCGCRGHLRPYKTLDYEKYKSEVRRYHFSVNAQDPASLVTPGKIFFDVGLWVADLLVFDLMNIYMFLKSHHFWFAWCLLSSFMVTCFDIFKHGGPCYVITAVKDSLLDGLLTRELNKMIVHDRSFEVPLFMAVTAYALPFGAQTSLEICQMIFSMCVMSFGMAKFLVENELAVYTKAREEWEDQEEKEDGVTNQHGSARSRWTPKGNSSSSGTSDDTNEKWFCAASAGSDSSRSALDAGAP